MDARDGAQLGAEAKHCSKMVPGSTSSARVAGMVVRSSARISSATTRMIFGFESAGSGVPAVRALVAEAFRGLLPSAARTPNDPAPIERSADRRDVVLFTG